MVFSYLNTCNIRSAKKFSAKEQMAQIAKTKVPAPTPCANVETFQGAAKAKGENKPIWLRSADRRRGFETCKSAAAAAAAVEGAKAKQLKPENCRPGNKHLGERRGIFSPTGRFFRYWGDHLHRRRHPACDNLH